MPPKKVVLAYSGGLDTSVILKWLIETYHCEVIAVTADLGQPEDLSQVKEKAIKTGASEAIILDLREEMAKDFVFPMMRAAAIYEGRYLLGTSIARPIIAKGLVDVARGQKKLNCRVLLMTADWKLTRLTERRAFFQLESRVAIKKFLGYCQVLRAKRIVMRDLRRLWLCAFLKIIFL